MELKSVNGEKKDDFDGIWVLVMTESTRGLLGRVKGHKKISDEVRNQILNSKVLTLDLAYDYFSDTQRMPLVDPNTGRPQMGPHGPILVVSREPIVTGFEFTLEKVDVHVHHRLKTVFFDDMNSKDRTTYQHFVLVADKKNQEMRAEALGLIIQDAAKNAKPSEVPHVTFDLRSNMKK